MQPWTTEMWQAAGIGLVVGIVIGYLLIRLTKGSVKKQAATENELQKAKQALEEQKQQLEKHFSESADLFKTLAQDYQKLYRHLAASSEQLLPETNKGLFLQNFMTSTKTETAVNEEDQPKDYTEGSSGILKN
ncbi:YhcB family protein [Pasteurellaceae bacterium 22721_9_1]